MRRRRTPPFVAGGVAALLVAFATACASAPPRPYEPRLVDVPDDEPYQHPFSNVQFEPRAGVLVRSDIVAHDAEGLGVSAYYRSPMFGATAEANFYPGTSHDALTDAEVGAHVRALERAVARSLPGAEVVERGEDTWVVNGADLHGFHTGYALPRVGDVDEPMESHLYVFPAGSWYLEFRIMYPADMSDDVRPQIARFLGAQWWSEAE